MKDIIYLDNAATTSLDPLVLEAMLPYMREHYGNPSSAYSLGRHSRLAIESSRKTVAEYLGVKATTIYFTSGGTESNNTAINAAVNDLGCTHIITSPIEHHAVLHTVGHQCSKPGISSSEVKIEADGSVDLLDLEAQLIYKTAKGIKCLVSLMHANNEIGTLLDIRKVGEICARYHAVFHSDCVQTIGHYPINLEACGLHFASASGHKFHGPKGTGMLYVRSGINFSPFIYGGGQERQKRAGTENVQGIVGFTKALALAMANQKEEENYIGGLNLRMRRALQAIAPGISFNSPEGALFTVLSVNFPAGSDTELMLALLDQKGICASGGSACNTGSDGGSHVIKALKKNLPGATLRFSFSRRTSQEDIDFAAASISNILKLSAPKIAL